jgi:hypothetical protein
VNLRIPASAVLALVVSSACVSVDPAPTAPIATSVPVLASATPVVELTPEITLEPSSQPSPTPTAIPATQSPAPSMALSGRIINSANGYAITLPDGWFRFELDSQMALLIRESIRHDPAVVAICGTESDARFEQCIDDEVELYEQQMATLQEESSIVAFNLESMTGGKQLQATTYTENLSAAFADYLVSTTPSYLRMGGIEGAIEADVVQLPAGEAARFAYRVPAEAGGPIDIVQYGIPTPSAVHWIVVQASRRDDRLDDLADQLASSFEILD